MWRIDCATAKSRNKVGDSLIPGALSHWVGSCWEAPELQETVREITTPRNHTGLGEQVWYEQGNELPVRMDDSIFKGLQLTGEQFGSTLFTQR